MSFPVLEAIAAVKLLVTIKQRVLVLKSAWRLRKARKLEHIIRSQGL